MPQALRGYGREKRDSTLRIDLQHLVVSIVDDVKISLPIERNSVWAVEKIALCVCRNVPVLRNLCDRITATIRDEDIPRLLVDRDSDRAAQTAGSKWLRLTFSIDFSDRVAVEVRLQEIAFVVDRVAGRAVKA